MKLFKGIFILMLFSSCVSSSKYNAMRVQYEEQLIESSLNYRVADYNAKLYKKELDESKQNTVRLSDTVKLQYNLIQQLQEEIRALNKDEDATAKLIVDRKAYRQQYEQLQQRFEKLKAVDKKFFPFRSMSGKVELFNNSFDFYILDLRKTELSFFWKGSMGIPLQTLINVKKQVEKQNKTLEFATNGGMFEPGYKPQGLLIIDGKKKKPIDPLVKGYGNFYMQPNGIFLIDKSNRAHVISTQEYPNFKGKIKHATQSGPALVLNNKMNGHFNKGSKNVHIRSGVGIISPNKIVFAISNSSVNFYDFATLFRDYFGCADALYLDGAISKMYLPMINRNQLNGNFGPIIGVVR